jgi:TIR domain
VPSNTTTTAIARGKNRGVNLVELGRSGVSIVAYDVFISYASEDKLVADAVCATLESHAVRCWIAPRDVLPGIPYGEAIIDAIRGCRIMILVFSSKSNASAHIPKEIERAVSTGVTIIPFRIEDVTPGKSLDYFIGNVHWLDALTRPLEQHLERLAHNVQTLLSREPQVIDRKNSSTTAALASPVASSPVLPPTVASSAPARATYRGRYMSLGALVVLLVLVAAGLYLPHRNVTHSAAPPESSSSAAKPQRADTKTLPAQSDSAVNASAAASPQTPVTLLPNSRATVKQEQADLPTAPGNELMQNKIGNNGQSSTHLRPAVPLASLVSRSKSSAESRPQAHSVIDGTATNPGLPRTVSPNNMPDRASSNQLTSTVGSPSIAADDPALEQLRHDLDLLSSRADSINESLNSLRDSQRSQGMELRGDVASSKARMQRYLDRTQSALSSRNISDARKYMGLAETEVTSLEKFLGR